MLAGHSVDGGEERHDERENVQLVVKDCVDLAGNDAGEFGCGRKRAGESKDERRDGGAHRQNGLEVLVAAVLTHGNGFLRRHVIERRFEIVSIHILEIDKKNEMIKGIVRCAFCVKSRRRRPRRR